MESANQQDVTKLPTAPTLDELRVEVKFVVSSCAVLVVLTMTNT